jgi:hypothetical protein
MILVIAAVALWLRGLWRPHWGGVAAGALVSFATLVPFFLEVAHEPRVFPGGEGHLGQNLVHVWPPLKGVLYWFRYASLNSSSSMLHFDFTPAFGAGVDSILTPFYSLLAGSVLPATVIAAIAANVWLWRRRRAEGPPRRGTGVSGPVWLREYALWLFAGCFVANSLSPSVVTWWHNLVSLHAAVLPLVFWAVAILETPRAPWMRRGIVAWGALALVLILGMAFGSNMYRRGGREAVAFVLESDHQMLHDLALTERWQISVDAERGAWPRKNSYFYVRHVRPFMIPPPPSGSPTPEIRWD